MEEIEKTMEAANRIRRAVNAVPDSFGMFGISNVDHRVANDLVEVSGFGFALEIDGEQYVICVEKV